jgi:hypothetical protein
LDSARNWQRPSRSLHQLCPVIRDTEARLLLVFECGTFLPGGRFRDGSADGFAIGPEPGVSGCIDASPNRVTHRVVNDVVDEVIR